MPTHKIHDENIIKHSDGYEYLSFGDHERFVWNSEFDSGGYTQYSVTAVVNRVDVCRPVY